MNKAVGSIYLGALKYKGKLSQVRLEVEGVFAILTEQGIGKSKWSIEYLWRKRASK